MTSGAPVMESQGEGELPPLTEPDRSLHRVMYRVVSLLTWCGGGEGRNGDDATSAGCAQHVGGRFDEAAAEDEGLGVGVDDEEQERLVGAEAFRRPVAVQRQHRRRRRLRARLRHVDEGLRYSTNTSFRFRSTTKETSLVSFSILPKYSFR